MQAERATFASVGEQLRERTEQLKELEALRERDKQGLESDLEAQHASRRLPLAMWLELCFWGGAFRPNVLRECLSKLSSKTISLPACASSWRRRDRSPGSTTVVHCNGCCSKPLLPAFEASATDSDVWGGCRVKVLELAELQRRLDASEEERQRVQAELQAEQTRLSSAMVDMAAVSSKLQAALHNLSVVLKAACSLRSCHLAAGNGSAAARH